MFVVNKYVTGFSRLATDQFSQESPSWEWSLLQKNQVRYWKQFGLGNMELLLAWKISFSPVKSDVSSFKLNSMLLSGKHKLFPAVLYTNSSYSKLVLMYFPGPNSLHFRGRGALNHLMRESDIDGLNSSLRHPQTLLSWGALGFIKANPCFYETFVNASDYCKIIIKYLSVMLPSTLLQALSKLLLSEEHYSFIRKSEAVKSWSQWCCTQDASDLFRIVTVTIMNSFQFC